MSKCGSNGGSEMKYGFQDDSILTYTFSKNKSCRNDHGF